MADIYCRNPRCREPWNAAGLYTFQDMTVLEATKFLNSQGCPTCDFGHNSPSDEMLPPGFWGVEDMDVWNETTHQFLSRTAYKQYPVLPVTPTRPRRSYQAARLAIEARVKESSI
jgi:hypothetical protein